MGNIDERSVTPATQRQRSVFRSVLARLLVLLGIFGLAVEVRPQDLAADRATREELFNDQRTVTIPSSPINMGATSGLFVPVILTASGLNNSFYTSELTLTNRGSQTATLRYTYRAAAGGGSGRGSETLAPGRQKIVPDAIAYLGTLGIRIPHSGNRIGTLRVEVSGPSDVSVSVRTTTPVPEGRAGLAYPGIATTDGFTAEAVYLCGLRQNRQDRSNVAIQNMGAAVEGNVTLRATAYSGDSGGGSRVLPEVTLAPGGFHQFNGILGTAGFAQGYVKVERVGGGAPFYAYGVINDQANSDGSFVFPVTASSLEGTGGQTFAGAVFATARSGDLSGVVIGARTGSPGGGGRYGVFYNAVPNGAGFDRTAWIDGLQQSRENRCNLALVNTGEVDGSNSLFELEIYDGATGQLVNAVTGIRIRARGWRQISGILGSYAQGVTQGYVRIKKTSGNNPFLAYGIINDGAAPGQRSGDGAYIPAMEERIHDPGTDPGTEGTEGMTDREVLEALYHATGGPDWINRTDWLSDAPLSEWFGVGTDGSGRVTHLHLGNNVLTGSIPPELGNLESLEFLGLSLNGLLDGTIPPELGSLNNLRELILQWVGLGGPIPPELGDLSQLESLEVIGSGFTGPIPPELGKLQNLKRLDLGFNYLGGPIPAELGNLSSLTLLSVCQKTPLSELSCHDPPHFPRQLQPNFVQEDASDRSGWGDWWWTGPDLRDAAIGRRSRLLGSGFKG